MHFSESRRTPQEEQGTLFRLDHVDHHLVEQFQPQFLARGGEHIVYTIPKYPDIVVKVDTAPLRRIVRWNTEHHQPPDALSDDLRSEIEKYVENENKRAERLRTYFGADRVPLQRKFLLKIPVTPSILQEIYKGEPPVAISEAWSLVLMQQKIEYAKETHVSVVSGYAERGDVPAQMYEEETERLVYGKHIDVPFTSERFTTVQHEPALAELLQRAQQEPGLKQALTDFVANSIRYAEETGETLDLAGADNVLFVRREGVWQYVLLDALYPGHDHLLNVARDIVPVFAHVRQMGAADANVMMNAINFVRTINGLAEYLGISDRIHLIPDDLQDTRVDFYTKIRGAV